MTCFYHKMQASDTENSDKGSVTILSRLGDYQEKMQILLSSSDYQRIDQDMTGKCQRKNNLLVAQLRRAGHITVPEKIRLTTYTATAPRIFGQYKYHKDGNPVRPIVSTINSPAYELSRFLATILKEAFSRPKFNIRNSAEFLGKLKHTPISNDNILVSFDVVNCFSNISVELALRIIERDFVHIATVCEIPRAKFMELLRFCLVDCNFFRYENNYYRQVMGLYGIEFGANPW